MIAFDLLVLAARNWYAKKGGDTSLTDSEVIDQFLPYTVWQPFGDPNQKSTLLGVVTTPVNFNKVLEYRGGGGVHVNLYPWFFPAIAGQASFERTGVHVAMPVTPESIKLIPDFTPAIEYCPSSQDWSSLVSDDVASAWVIGILSLIMVVVIFLMVWVKTAGPQ